MVRQLELQLPGVTKQHLQPAARAMCRVFTAAAAAVNDGAALVCICLWMSDVLKGSFEA